MMRKLLLGGLLLASSCQSTTGEPTDPVETAMRVLRAAWDVTMQVDGTAALKKHRPEIVPLIDASGDGVITLAELEMFVASLQEPEALALLYLIARGVSE